MSGKVKRQPNPAISEHAARAIDEYGQALAAHADMQPGTLRNYVSDLRLFAAWFEREGEIWTPEALTTPAIVRYRSFLQNDQRLRPASINRTLISIKRYCAWCVAAGLIGRDPAGPVKLVPEVPQPPRQISDREESALLAAVEKHGTPRDQALISFLLHTGLRAAEACALRRDDVTIGPRSGVVRVYGKRNKYREVPLNSTARAALTAYLATREDAGEILFPSGKTGGRLTERALGYLIARYAELAKVADLSPHDLRHRFGYRMAESTPLHRLAQLMGHDSLDTTMIYVQATQRDLQNEVEKIAWQ